MILSLLIFWLFYTCSFQRPYSLLEIEKMIVEIFQSLSLFRNVMQNTIIYKLLLLSLLLILMTRINRMFRWIECTSHRIQAILLLFVNILFPFPFIDLLLCTTIFLSLVPYLFVVSSSKDLCVLVICTVQTFLCSVH